MTLRTHLVLVTLLHTASSAFAIAEGGCCQPVVALPLVVTEAPAPSSELPAPGASLPSPSPVAPVGHALRGVVVDVLADKPALLVKHEEIPGVMRAMTMLLKVDAAVLPTVAKGQAITATLVKKPDGWWLQDVKPVKPGA